MIKWIKDKKTRRAITKTILEALPKYFGVESARQAYIEESQDLDMVAYYKDNQPVGLLSLKPSSQIAMTIHVMGVLKTCQKQGIGKALVDAAEKKAVENGFKVLTVKTLDPSREDEGYAKTRKFYQSVGFEKLETFKTLWDESNPCMLMIKWIQKPLN